MARARRNVKSGKLIQWFPDFSGGLNTEASVHQVGDNEFVEGYNTDIDEQGAVSKRRGYSRITASLGAGRIQGMYLYQRFTSRELLAVHNGKLYRYDTPSLSSFLGTGNWLSVPIRRHTPVGVKAVLTDLAEGETLGANLALSTAYEYSVAAKDASGSTLVSSVSRVTQDGTTLKKVVVSWYKVFGATGYDIYRDGKLIKSVGDVDTWTDMGTDAPTATVPPVANSTSVAIPLESEVEFVSYNDKCFFTTGAGLCIYDGAFAFLVTPYVPLDIETEQVGFNSLLLSTSSIHKCRFIKLHWDRLFVSGDPEYPQNYYFSDLALSPAHPQLYFPAFHAGDVTTANGSPITGMYNYRDALVFFTSTSIHALFGAQPDINLPDPFTQRLVHPSIGCIAPRSIVMVGNVVVFVSRLGIYALTNVVASNTAMNIQLISEKIQPTFKRLLYPEKAVAIFHDQQYKVAFPNDSVILRWYSSKHAWVLDTYPPANAYITVDNDLYVGLINDGVVLKFGVVLAPDPLDPLKNIEVDSYADDGAVVPLYFRTKTFDQGAGVNMKKFRQFFLAGKQYTVPSFVDIKAFIDYVEHNEHVSFNASSMFGAWEVGESRLGWVDVVTTETRFKGKGRHCYFEFRNEYANQPITIYGLGLEYKIKSV